jgi:protein-L-isoaspartate(D-aspartate) O-methyltransferase
MNTLYASRRLRMVREQIEHHGVHNPRVLKAMLDVPRHEFVPLEFRNLAYVDQPIPIGEGQTISQPFIVAVMTSLLDPGEQETVLEVGTGSGYQAAVLSRLAGTVHTIERYPDLAEQARRRLERLGYSNVVVHVGDGSLGWKEAAPYATIIVTAGAPALVEPLVEQLAEGGRMVIPVGGGKQQDLLFVRRQQNRIVIKKVIPVAFVPLRGAWGWKEGEK